MKKVLISLISILLALVLLVSCGTTIGNETQSEAPIETETPTETEPACSHDEWEEIARTDALALADGSVTRECKSCGHTETEMIPATGTIKVLAIGNSFSADATAHLQGLMKAAGVEDFVIGNMSIGGCSLDKHWELAQSGEEAYSYSRYTKAGKTKTEANLDTVLTTERWDVIVLQQVSNNSGMPATYSNLKNLIDFVSATSLNPNAKIMWHMTWAYQSDSTKSAFSNYKKDQMTMYNAIVNTVNSQVLTQDEIVGVIPAGTAIQNLRTSYLGDTLTRDGYHMSHDVGRYTVGLTWLVKLTGASIENFTWVPDSYPQVKNDLSAIKEAVLDAIETPFSVTPSTHIEADYERPETEETPAETEAPAETQAPTDIGTPTQPIADANKLKLTLVPGPDDGELFQALGLDLGEYTLLDWSPTYRAFWGSQSSIKLNTKESETALKYIGSRLLTKTDLPVGSVIILDDGYRYRPEAWIDSSTKNSAETRPKNTSAAITLADDAWWSNYTYRAFNLSRKSGNVTTDDADHLRIYVPSGK